MLRAGFLPLFGLHEISVLTGLQALWETDVWLALLVTAFALFAPYLKTLGLALVHFGLADHGIVPTLGVLGKLAMADIFLICALYRGGEGDRRRPGRDRLGPLSVHRLHPGLAAGVDPGEQAMSDLADIITPVARWVMLAGGAAAWLWSLWRGAVERGQWRVVHLVMAAMMAIGLGTAMMQRTLSEVAAGLVVILLAVALLISYRGPGRSFAVVQLVWGMVLAIGTTGATLF